MRGVVAALAKAVLVLTVVSSTISVAGAADKLWVLVGTYTQKDSKGVYVLQLDLQTGKLTETGATHSVNPSFLAVHPNQKFVYSVGEISDFNGQKAGAINAYSFDAKTGALQFLNAESSVGTGPCHLNVDATGQYVLAANYGGGSACVLPVLSDGKVAPASSFVQHTGSSVNPGRQKAPHAHSINLDPSNRFAVVADLGLDKVMIYNFNPKHGTLTQSAPAFAKVAPGSGPRHFAFHPSGRFAYVINEMLLTMTAFAFDADSGSLTELQTISTLPPGTENVGSTAEVRVHPSGRFLYGSNRGHDSIVVYAIDQETGKLTYVENESTGGQTPRNFYVEPSGKFLLAENQQTNNIVVLKIDPQTGALEPTGNEIAIPSPVCIRTIPVQE